jgi:hypothetical protein
MMKKLLFLLSISLFLSSTFSAASISRTYADPYPLLPGKPFTVVFTVQNTGSGKLDNFTVQIDPEHPFSVRGDQKKSYTITSLDPDKTANIDFTLWVDEGVVEGNYDLNVLTCSGTCSSYISRDFSLWIKPSPILVIEDYTFSEDLEPGKNINITLDIKNKGNGIARNSKILISTIPSGYTTNNYFSVIGSGTVFSFGDIDPQQTISTTFTLGISKDLLEGIYNLPVTITSSGYNASDYLGLNILSHASLK